MDKRRPYVLAGAERGFSSRLGEDAFFVEVGIAPSALLGIAPSRWSHKVEMMGAKIGRPAPSLVAYGDKELMGAIFLSRLAERFVRQLYDAKFSLCIGEGKARFEIRGELSFRAQDLVDEFVGRIDRAIALLASDAQGEAERIVPSAGSELPIAFGKARHGVDRANKQYYISASVEDCDPPLAMNSEADALRDFDAPAVKGHIFHARSYDTKRALRFAGLIVSGQMRRTLTPLQVSLRWDKDIDILINLRDLKSPEQRQAAKELGKILLDVAGECLREETVGESKDGVISEAKLGEQMDLAAKGLENWHGRFERVRHHIVANVELASPLLRGTMQVQWPQKGIAQVILIADLPHASAQFQSADLRGFWAVMKETLAGEPDLGPLEYLRASKLVARKPSIDLGTDSLRLEARGKDGELDAIAHEVMLAWEKVARKRAGL